MRDLLFIAGGPASGKSILANKIRSHFNGITISTSKLVRYLSMVYNNNDIYNGDYFPFESVLRNSVKTMIEYCPIKDVPMVVDGMPRHLPQLTWVCNMFMYNRNSYNVHVVILQSDDATSFARMSRRSDLFDNHDIIHKRIDTQLPAIDEMLSSVCNGASQTRKDCITVYDSRTLTEDHIYGSVLNELSNLGWGSIDGSTGH